MELRSFKATLAYDGTGYVGWQVQPNGPTIQQAVERALGRVIGSRVKVIASGRTDAGVHALGQVASFCCATRHAPAVLQRALNANLPADIVVLRLEQAEPGFHAIRDAVGKRYRYLIHDGGLRDVFAQRWAWHCGYALDTPAMQRAARYLRGEHDFSSFEASGSPRASSVRTLHDVSIVRQVLPTGDGPLPGGGFVSEATSGAGRIVIEMEANGFLYNMVRNLVGSLVEVGRGAWSPETMRHVLQAGDRKQAGPTAPPHGLYLLRVDYGKIQA